ncbi:MAG: M10 family metallopeptidase C-terminal domain-containing protein [Rhizobiaceae bacterium]|nr:M10 family metallopeptidase C-terminal domain-containing protein [Rhizobiaceae bacterium]
MSNIVLGYVLGSGEGDVALVATPLGAPNAYDGGINVTYAVGAFTGRLGLPTGPFANLTEWNAFVAALQNKQTEVNSVGFEVYLHAAAFIGIGGTGNDTFQLANVGVATIRGGDGNDTIRTNYNQDGSPFGASNDVLSGEDGNDTLDGGAGNDTLDGGAGDDTLIGGAGTQDKAIYRGAWKDYTITGVGTLTITDRRDGSPDGTDTVSGVELFQFSNGTFSIADIMNDAPTDIALSGLTVTEGASDGTTVGNLSATDDDLALGDTADFDLVDDAGGRFALVGTQIVVANGRLIDFETAQTHQIRVRVTDAHGATLEKDLTIAVGNVTPEIITGTTGDDILTGGSDRDIISGLAGNDTLGGMGGDDVLIGGAGADVMGGGAGNDTFRIAGTEGVGDTFAGGAGTDRIEVMGAASAALSAFSASAASIEQWIGNGKGLLGTRGADRIDLGGLTAMTRLPFIDGGAGNDTLTGSRLVDDLRGGAGNDTLAGGAGNDVLAGGLGRDLLAGGLGRDRFDFNTVAESRAGAARDQIRDFKRGQDKIDLRDIDASTKAGGNQAFNFIGAAAFSKAAGELRYSKGVVQADVNGDGRADFEIRVGLATMSKGDFIL